MTDPTPTIEDQLVALPATVRPIVEATLSAVRASAGDAEEVVYRSRRPRSASMMWKLVHYRVGDFYVVGIGAFTKHANLFFYRGRELDAAQGLLQGSGKDMRSITLRAPDDATDPRVVELLRKAFALARGQ